MSTPWTVAVIGPRTLAGEALLDALDTADFSLRQVHLLDHGEAVGEELSLAGRDWSLGDVTAPPAGLDFAWVTDPALIGPAEQAAYAAAGVPLIDVTGNAPWSAATPAWGFASPRPTAKGAPPPVLRCADTASLMLTRVLTALGAVLTPRSVDVTLLMALSDAGQAAVQALGEETAALLSFKQLQRGPLPVQTAFNLVPEVGAIGDDGHAAVERRLAADLPLLSGHPGLSVRCTAVWAPVFYGHGIALSLRSEGTPELERVRSALSAAEGLRLQPAGEGRPTPVTDASGQGEVYLGRLRVMAGDEPGLSLWLVGDNQHLGGAAQAIRVAGILIRDHLGAIRE
jgi:aspartate-semialdehyde dehydrogenase